MKEKNLILKSSYKTAHKKIKVKCSICQTPDEDKAYYLWQQGCKNCNDIARARRRKAKLIKTYGSLLDHPFLIKELSSSNKIKPEEIHNTSTKLFEWECSTCGHKWSSSPVSRLRNLKKNGLYRICKLCSDKEGMIKRRQAIIKKSGSFADNYPKLLKEWDYEKNTVHPNEITASYSKQVNWICKINKEHLWPAVLANRTKKKNPTNCPFCNKYLQISRAEIRVYTELKYIFKNTIWSTRIKKKQIDIFLEDYNIAVEVDGHHHKDKIKRDKIKNEFLKKTLGIRVLRLRDSILKRKISKDDFFVNTGHILFTDIKKLLIKINNITKVKKAEKFKLSKYLKRKKFINDKEFKILASKLPAIPYQHSLAAKFPDIAKEWNFKKNKPMTPSMVTPGSGEKYFWKCDVHKKSYPMTVNHRTNGHGCDLCGKIKKAVSYTKTYIKSHGSLQSVRPDLAKQFMTKLNKIHPKKVSRGDKREYWWHCKEHRVKWKQSVKNRVDAKSIHGRKYCLNKNFPRY